MRTVAGALQSAIDHTDGIRLSAKLSIYRNRVFTPIGDFVTANASAYAETAGIHLDNPLSQSMGMDASLNKAITVMAVGGNILLYAEGSPTAHTLNYSGNLACPTWSRPTVVPPYVFFSHDNGDLFRATYNPSDFSITAVSAIATPGKKGSLYGIDQNHAVYLFIDDGGVGVTLYTYSSGWTADTWAHRFMFPTEVWSDSITEGGEVYSKLRRLNFAGVALVSGVLYVYLSSPDGSVIGVRRLDTGLWTDTFVAFPEDLTCFAISNVISDSNNRIHIAGQFVRTDSFDSGATYNLSIWSDDGKTFSVDRFTLFSTTGKRLMVGLDSDQEIFSDANITIREPASWEYFQTNADKLDIDPAYILTVQGELSNGWDITLANGNEYFANRPQMVVGSVAILSIGVKVGGSFTWSQYDQSILSKIQEGDSNGVRPYSITIVPEGLWRVSTITYPFYLELQSKESVQDDVDAMDNLYAAPQSHGISEPFSCDLWGAVTPFQIQHHAENETNTHTSEDVVSHMGLDDYPQVVFPFTLKIYGWSRIGVPAEIPNVTDNTPSGNPNDDFVPFMVVRTGVNGEERTIDIPIGLAVSSISYPPQTYKAGNSRAGTGTYPVEYAVDDEDIEELLAGDQILRVGVYVHSTTATVYFIERIDIPEITMYITAPSFVSEWSNPAILPDFTLPDFNLNFPIIPFIPSEVTTPTRFGWSFPIGNNTDVLPTGMAGWVEVPFDCLMDSVKLVASPGVSGSVVIDIWRCTYAQISSGTHPVDGDHITGSNPPTLASSNKSTNTLSGWTTQLYKGDWLFFNIDSADTLALVTLAIQGIAQQ